MGTVLLPKGGDLAERLYFASKATMNIPLIRPHIGAAHGLAIAMFIAKPGLDRLRLKGFEATEKLFPGIIRKGAGAKMQAEVEAHEKRLNSSETRKEDGIC